MNNKLFIACCVITALPSSQELLKNVLVAKDESKVEAEVVVVLKSATSASELQSHLKNTTIITTSPTSD